MRAEARYETAWIIFQRNWTQLYTWGLVWVVAVSTVGYLSRRFLDMDFLTILTMLGCYIPVRRAAHTLADFECPRCRKPFFAGNFVNVWNDRCIGCRLQIWSTETDDDLRQAKRLKPP